MARIVKDRDVRRKELLAVALEQFETTGFERTSIEQITQAVGVAKGTFYHYFTSKQDLLRQLAVGWADGLFAEVERQLEKVAGDAPTRLRAVFALGADVKLQHLGRTMAMSRVLYSEENLRLRHGLLTEWVSRFERILVPILADGVKEGHFDIDDPGQTAAILVSLWYGWGERQATSLLAIEDQAELFEAMEALAATFETAWERILGLPKGAFDLHSDIASRAGGSAPAATTTEGTEEGERP